MSSATRKAYYENNKEACLKKQAEYRAANQAQIKEFNRKYYQENAEKMKKQRMKRYFEVERPKQQEKITCPCGEKLSRGALSRHKGRGPHQKWLESSATLEEYIAERGKDEGFLIKAARMLNAS